MARLNGRRLQALIALTLETYGDTCHLCGKPGATTIDHIVPISCGGDNSLDNLRPAHQSCNSSRGARSLGDWFARHPIATGRRAASSRDWLAFQRAILAILTAQALPRPSFLFSRRNSTWGLVRNRKHADRTA